MDEASAPRGRHRTGQRLHRPHDIDGDGKVDFALGAGWTKVGTVQWITRGEKPDDPWTVHFIDKEPWTHRMRWADVLGTGKPQLVVSPLNKSGENEGARLLAYEVPENPRTDRWPSTVLNATFNRMHNHWHQDVNGDGIAETFTASQEGVHGIATLKTGKRETAKVPHTEAAGEVKTGTLAKPATKFSWFLCTVEPMHGTRLVAYVRDGDAEKNLRRQVLQEGLGRGHALWTIDLDGDGSDEIVLGHSQKGTGEVQGPGIYVYDADDAAGKTWTKHVLDDGGIATEDLVATDLTGDGQPDIVAGGRETHNVVLYVNKAKNVE